MAAKNTYDVVLEKVGNQPLMTTKILCGTLGLGLAVAKGMVDKAPRTVAKGLDKEKALALFKEMESIGNIVSIPGMEMKTKSPVSDQNTDEHTILLRNDGLTKRTGFRNGDYSKWRVALIPMRNYIHNAMLAFKEAFDHGYDPTKLAEICYNGIYDALMKNEDQWFFDDSEVEIMKIAAVCDPESYAYFMSSIAKSFDDYNHKYIYEVLTGEEYPG